jgi:large subunit ribosomal protein L23
MRPDIVIKGALLSEKAMMLAAQNTFALKVDLQSTKEDIKRALKKLFDVDVVSVNTSITRGKYRKKARSKKGGPVMVKAANVKKAFVQLKAGQSLPTASLVPSSVESEVTK